MTKFINNFQYSSCFMTLKNILFQKPKHNMFLQQGLTLVDMHNHSAYSDTTTQVPSIAKKARKLGIGVCLSDHNEVAGNIRLAKENPDLLVIPGMEVTTKELAHVLMYFYSHSELQNFFATHIKDARHGNPNLATQISVSDLVDMSKKYNCVLAPAHPFAFPKRFSFISAMERGFVDKSVLRSLHAVEVICGANLRGMNQRAVLWKQELNKAAIGGSDAHSLETLGSVVTMSEAHTVEDFLDSIKKKQTTVVGTETRLYQRPVPYAKMASKHLKYLGPTMKTQYELGIKQPMLSARKMLQKKFNVQRREEQREALRAGLSCLAKELQFQGYPSIKRPAMMKKIHALKERFL